MEFCIVIFAGLLGFTAAAPMLNADDVTVDDSIAYLTQYQYMGENNPDKFSASLTSREQYVEGLMHFQFMAGLPQTGELDQATKAKMVQPRCGVPDQIDMGSIAKRRKRYITEGGRWNRKQLTWRLDSSDVTGDMTESAQVAEIERAFKVWSDNSGLSFSRVTYGGDIVIKFASYEHGDGNSFDGSGGVLAHAFFPYYGGDAHFDDSERFTMNTYSGINLFQVAAHEFGHSLGLGHSSDQNALMAAFYAGYQPDFQLHYDDIMGIQSLYGPNTDTDNSGNGNDPTTTTTKSPTTTTRVERPTTTTRAPTVDPEYCRDGRFDAITATNDGSTYAFRGSNFYKILTTGVAPGYPQRISSVWYGVPNNVDATLYWPARRGWERCNGGWCWVNEPGMTFIFKGIVVYAFVDTQYQWHDLISNAFPGIPDNLDAAFVWGRNDRTYFMKGSQYYRYATHAARGTRADAGYPRDLSVWWTYSDQIHQLTINRVDAVLQWNQNERTYFFVGDRYYRFNDGQFKVDDGYPRSIAQWWYVCHTGDNLGESEMDVQQPEFIDTGNGNAPTGNEAHGEGIVGDGSNGSSRVTSAVSVVLFTCLMTVMTHVL